MDFPAAKAPPRYVPTLTEVVTEPDAVGTPRAALAEAAGPELAWQDLAADASPAFTPEPEAEDPLGPWDAVPSQAAGPLASSVVQVLDEVSALQAEERLVQSLLERVEHGLDERLRDTIAQVVQEQTRSVTLRLQEALESVVRQAVQQALAQEHEQERNGARR